MNTKTEAEKESLSNRYQAAFWVLLGLCVSVLVLLAAMVGYSYFSKPGPIESSWHPSPDEAYDAVLLAVGSFGGPGWGSSGGCELYVIWASEEATDLPRSQRVFFARRITNDVDYRWKRRQDIGDPRQLWGVFGLPELRPLAGRSGEREFVELRLVPPEGGSGLPEGFLEDRSVEKIRRSSGAWRVRPRSGYEIEAGIGYYDYRVL